MSDTRTAILDAAERLFSEKGYGATSVREITRTAGVNVAAVHYHFGGKEDVLRGVTDRIVGPLNSRRIDLLAAAARRSDPIPVRDVLDAFIRPDVETLQQLQQRGPTVAYFIGQIYSDRTPWIQQMASEQFRPSGEAFAPALAAALPHLDEAELAWRMSQVVGVIVRMFSTWPSTGMTAEQSEATIRRHVAFLAPALSAPSVEGAAID